MIRIYTAPSCASCRKVKAWLKEHNIPYKEKNIFSTLLRKEELRELLERSENGTDDIISKRSKIIKENKVDIEDMSVNELIEFIQKNPSILKRPIIIDERRFQVGYNAEEIRAFIPRELRRYQECEQADYCPQFSDLDIKKAYEADYGTKASKAKESETEVCIDC
ncbi:MAG: transcriptional regulator Spx [Erysipelotrichaceae bacterium]|nr:transcriptional regulator Spx [Erysipelotrichaceae bacterium]